MIEKIESPYIIKLNRVDLLTLTSVFTTFTALISAIDGRPYFAMVLLFIAMIADALDGILARKWGLERDFGRYLDGFMDMQIYLITPGVVMYQWGFDGYWSLFIMAMITSGSVRLAAFNQTGNIKEENGLSYLGMPVFWSIFILSAAFVIERLLGSFSAYISLAVGLSLFSYYMVVRKPFFKFKSISQIVKITLTGILFFTILELLNHDKGSPIMDILLALYLLIPAALGGVLHMMFVSKNRLSFLVVPVSKSLFGANKTWRGVILVPLLTMVSALVLMLLEFVLTNVYGEGLLPNINILFLGFITGVGYILGEFPNSYFKRYLGIGPGELPEKNKYFFMAIDQLDSAIGIAIMYSLVFGFSFEILWVYVLCFPITALLVKRWLFNNKLKSSAV
ncbi:CDP-archaeol synthase [Moritella sp. 36]|uniref:CDP-archaeol synthase n=1 Tax=Moritella sp. 36 TaxID=2746233 RepID=UPI001BAD36F0|nr:CDP-archaeol synthase [Moritella sp. 36]QUM89818.1 CDP-archaeol synthase [Moritella sp. 36]